MKLDNLDLKILQHLDYDARQSYSDIGKSIKRSKQFVATRIAKLENEGIIKNYSIDTNLRALGYVIFNIFFQFQKVSGAAEKKILDYLKKSPYVGYFVKTLGNWDVFISVKAKDTADFYQFLGDLHKKCGGYIKKELINLEIQCIDKNLAFLSQENNSTLNSIFLKKSVEKTSLKNYESKLLLELRNNPTMSYLELSNKIGKSYRTSVSIIDKLKKLDIIKRTKANINTEKIGYNRYLFMIEISSLGREELQRYLDYLSAQKNICYIIECIGAYNIVCDVYSKDTQELISIIDRFKNNFSKSLQSIEFLQVINREKEHFEV